MRSALAAQSRAFVAALSAAQRAELELKRNPYSDTGFVGVIKVKGKFQARLQVPGDGKGGTKKRKQHSLPGLFDTAEDAAVNLAVIKKALKDAGEEASTPPKQNKKHKPRQTKQPAAQPQPQPLQPRPTATAMAMPMFAPMFNVPFATVSPLPMPQLGYAQPRV